MIAVGKVVRLIFVVVIAVGLTCTVAAAQGMMRGDKMGRTVPGVTDLTSDQQQEIAGIRMETQNKVRDIQMDQSLTSAERMQMIQETKSQGHEQVLSVLTADQREQFNMWWESRYRMPVGAGPGQMAQRMDKGMGGMMMSGMVPGVTNLTQEQQQEIARLRTTQMQHMREIRMDSSLTVQERRQMMKDAKKEHHEQVMNVLTDEQKMEFQEWWSAHPMSRMGSGGMDKMMKNGCMDDSMKMDESSMDQNKEEKSY